MFSNYIFVFEKPSSRTERIASKLRIAAVNLRNYSASSSDFFHEIRTASIINFSDSNSVVVGFAQTIEALIRGAAKTWANIKGTELSTVVNNSHYLLLKSSSS